LVEQVTDQILSNVLRLHESIGVQKVLVNNLFPLGCAPSQTRPNNYAYCDDEGNHGAALHNRRLAEKLDGIDGVLVVDLSAAFSKIVGPHADGDMANQFTNRLAPCCESFDPKGYCGQVDPETDEPLYKVCENPDGYFFWDDMNPTQAGWEAVMWQLDRSIREFLGLVN
jgi:phospholipase/lecithinase/hemolysin